MESFFYKWTGPYTIENITKKGLCTLKNERSTVLDKKFNVGLLKPYSDPLAVDPQDEEEPHPVPPEKSQLQLKVNNVSKPKQMNGGIYLMKSLK